MNGAMSSPYLEDLQDELKAKVISTKPLQTGMHPFSVRQGRACCTIGTLLMMHSA